MYLRLQSLPVTSNSHQVQVRGVATDHPFVHPFLAYAVAVDVAAREVLAVVAAAAVADEDHLDGPILVVLGSHTAAGIALVFAEEDIAVAGAVVPVPIEFVGAVADPGDLADDEGTKGPFAAEVGRTLVGIALAVDTAL